MRTASEPEKKPINKADTTKTARSSRSSRLAATSAAGTIASATTPANCAKMRTETSTG